MPSPSQFFSAIIGASAGVTGVVIAVTTVVHSLGVQSRTPRTRELHGVLVDLNNEYWGPFQDVSLALSGKLQNGLYRTMLDNYDRCRRIIDNEDQYEQSKVFQAHIYRIEYYLSDDNLQGYHDLSEEQIDAIIDSSRWLMTSLSRGDDSENLYKALTGTSPTSSYWYDRVFPEQNRIKRWFQERHLTHQGQTIESLYKLAEQFSHDAVPQISKGRQETLIDYDSPLRKVILAIGGLFLVGIIIPSMFLLSAPNPIFEFPAWCLFWIQVGILLSFTVLVIVVVYLLLEYV